MKDSTERAEQTIGGILFPQSSWQSVSSTSYLCNNCFYQPSNNPTYNSIQQCSL